jgi:dihydroneopterin aldolase
VEGTIEIRALRCRGRQGTTTDERAREQSYLVDVVVRTDLADAVRADDLASALDISALAKVVRESVAERPRARVRVLKPEPDGLEAGGEAVELVLRR